MVQYIKRISIKAPVLLAHEIMRSLPQLSVSTEAFAQKDGINDGFRDETEIVVEYDHESPLRWLLAWSVKIATIVALVAVVWVIRKG